MNNNNNNNNNINSENTENINGEKNLENNSDRLSIITTRQGDFGYTSTTQAKHAKHDAPIEVLGAVDEANASLGLIHAQLDAELAKILKLKTAKQELEEKLMASPSESSESSELLEFVKTLEELELFYSKSLDDITHIQNELFNVGACISAPDYVSFNPDALKFLDQINQDVLEKLPPLKEFILPAGSITAAHTHLARTIVRRAERVFWGFYEHHDIYQSPQPSVLIGQYLNRLSDYLFNYARIYHQTLGIPEVLWQK